jgi:hypothetical protein
VNPLIPLAFELRIVYYFIAGGNYAVKRTRVSKQFKDVPYCTGDPSGFRISPFTNNRRNHFLFSAELSKIGVEKVCGIDIVKNAKKAVERDRPDIYRKYLIEDITDLSISLREDLESESFNCMTQWQH